MPSIIYIDADLHYGPVKSLISSCMGYEEWKAAPPLFAGGSWGRSEGIRQAVTEIARERGLRLHVEQGQCWTLSGQLIKDSHNGLAGGAGEGATSVAGASSGAADGDGSGSGMPTVTAAEAAAADNLRVHDSETEREQRRLAWLLKVFDVMEAGDNPSALAEAIGPHGRKKRIRKTPPPSAAAPPPPPAPAPSSALGTVNIFASSSLPPPPGSSSMPPPPPSSSFGSSSNSLFASGSGMPPPPGQSAPSIFASSSLPPPPGGGGGGVFGGLGLFSSSSMPPPPSIPALTSSGVAATGIASTTSSSVIAPAAAGGTAAASAVADDDDDGGPEWEEPDDPAELWIDSCANDRRHNTPLNTAAKLGRVNCLRALIDVHGAQVNRQADRSMFTALLVASFAGHEDCVKALLARGADPTLTNKWGETAMKAATEGEKEGVVELLRQHAEAQKAKRAS